MGIMDTTTLLQGQKVFWMYENEPCMIFASKVRRLKFSSAGAWACSPVIFPSVIMTLTVPEIVLTGVRKVPAATPFLSAEA